LDLLVLLNYSKCKIDLLEKRLIALGRYFGALPIHNGLWQSATDTKDNFMSRLAILHMVHEARGLDVHPQTRLRFLNQKDELSVKLLDVLYQDEITHVACGLKWFEYSCKKYDLVWKSIKLLQLNNNIY
jgi:uncharacterized ferritin-like protein (DUF455 family)